MFIKLLKHDLSFSKNTFLGIGVALISIALLFRLTEFLDFGFLNMLPADVIFGIIMGIATLVIFIVSIMQIHGFYKHNIFGDTGHLTLTLPVKRIKIIASKVIVALIWFNFMVLAGHLTVGIMTDINPFESFTWVSFFVSNISALLYISMLYLWITLSNCTFGKLRMNGLISALFMTPVVGLYLWVNTLLNRRFSDAVDMGFFTAYTPIVELRYGRLDMGNAGFIDLWAIGIYLAASVLFIMLSYFLLKEKASV